MPNRPNIHRLYLLDQEPDDKTVQGVMKKEVGDCRITGWRVEDRSHYGAETPDNPGLLMSECVSVIVGYVKEGSKNALRTVRELRLPYDGQELNEKKIRAAVLEAVGEVKIIDWRKANPVQRVEDPAQVNHGKYKVQKDSEIVVRYMGGNAPESLKSPRKHRLLFKREIPDERRVEEHMKIEVGECTIIKWYPDETLPQAVLGQNGTTRIIVEYLGKK
jgi:hypothetical protein